MNEPAEELTSLSVLLSSAYFIQEEMVSKECPMPSFGVALTHLEDEDGNSVNWWDYDYRIRSFDPVLASEYIPDSHDLPDPPYPLSLDLNTGFFYLEALKD